MIALAIGAALACAGIAALLFAYTHDTNQITPDEQLAYYRRRRRRRHRRQETKP